ncbi:receptor-type tyrosine-protein phosphatase alpha-like isoform X2 [Pristis pectinata]|nr:receptor-type tyrosine-protein phosphatase alpha-like isoform X2 [Pristis pectinata]
MSVSASANSITLQGSFSHCPRTTSDAPKLNVQLDCTWSQSYYPRCKSSKPSTSEVWPLCSLNLYNLTCKNLRPYAEYCIQLAIIYSAPSSPSGFGSPYLGHGSIRDTKIMRNFLVPVHTPLVNTRQAVPIKPRLLVLDMDKRKIKWELQDQCSGPVHGYQLTIVGSRSYNSSFYFEEVLTLNASTLSVEDYNFECATTYNITLQARNLAGLGEKYESTRHSSAKDPPAPIIQGSVSDLTHSSAVIRFTSVSSPCTAVKFYEVVVTLTRERAWLRTQLDTTCRNSQLGPFNAKYPLYDYISLRIPAANVSGTIAVTIGDGQTTGNLWNRPLEPDRGYTILLRVVSEWKGEVKFVCAQYEPFYVSSGKVAIAVSTLLIIVLLFFLVVFLLYRRRKQRPQEPREKVFRPLIRSKSVVNTEISVCNLLKFLMKMRLLDEESGDEDVKDDGLTKEYKNLSNYPLHACTVAKEPHNASKNRFLTILPYDNSRVVLKGNSGDKDGFINASYVDGYRKQNYYIATQGPLTETITDFWQMVWQENCTIIVMLTRISEQGKCKCERYWPKEASQTFGEFTITRVSEKSPSTKDFSIRTLQLHKAGSAPGSSRQIQHFHYLQWPDHGVPRNPIGIYRLLKAINQTNRHTGPLVIHCSAGVGRTGTFIAIDYLLKMAEEESKVDVFQCVDRMRCKRPGMVQTQEQYRFIYLVLLEAQLFGDTAIPVVQFRECLSSLIEGQTGRPSSSCKREFETLQTYSQLFKSHRHTEALRLCNIAKNRCSQILPAEHVRPSLLSVKNLDGSAGYINAVFTERHGLRDRFILTQLPLMQTLADFWALVYDQNCTCVVNLSRLTDLDQTYVAFWPEEGVASYGPFLVEMQSYTILTDITERHLVLRKHGQKLEREVKVLQLDSWPMGEPVPQSPQPIISIDQRVQMWQKQGEQSPVLVTCWDGASRCGLYCTASNVCQHIRQYQLVDIFHAVKTTRSSRPQAIGTLDQYSFCYWLAQVYLETDGHISNAGTGCAQEQDITNQDSEDLL